MKEILIFNIAQIVANVIAWIGVAPVLDIAIYAEPVNKVFIQGVVAAIVNIITVAVIGTVLLIAYAKTRTQKGSLEQED